MIHWWQNIHESSLKNPWMSRHPWNGWSLCLRSPSGHWDSYRKYKEIGEIFNLGSDGVCQYHFYRKWKNGKGQKLRKIHWELETFNFHFPKMSNVFTCINFGFNGNATDPENPLFLTLDPLNYSKEFRRKPTSFSENIVFEISESRK